MMTGLRERGLLAAFLGLALGCEWLAEERAAARRQSAETNFVDAVATAAASEARGMLDADRSLVSSVAYRSSSLGDSRSRRPVPRETALTMALERGRRDMVELLLAFGADPNLADGRGLLPLAAALSAEQERPALLVLLLEKGADPEKVHYVSALHHAAGSTAPDAEEILGLLLAKASGAGRPSQSGWMPLHSAAAAASVPAIRLLLAKGADPNVPTAAPAAGGRPDDEAPGSTPLSLVARDRQIGAAAALCARGADPDLADATGVSARQVAAVRAAARAATTGLPRGDVARHQNMAAFLARGGGCDELLGRRRRGEAVAELEVARIANESECETGWGSKCGSAGAAFYWGEGAPEDDAKALAFFRKGCQARDAWSCGMVGIFHVDGRIVPKDPGQGARWLAMGCEPDPPQPHPDAQACDRLGVLYAEGSGVAKDLMRARTLFKKACDKKHEKACANLAKYGSTGFPG